MTVTAGHGDSDGRTMKELTARAVVLVSLVTFLIMIGLPAAWALAAAH